MIFWQKKNIVYMFDLKYVRGYAIQLYNVTRMQNNLLNANNSQYLDFNWILKHQLEKYIRSDL